MNVNKAITSVIEGHNVVDVVQQLLEAYGYGKPYLSAYNDFLAGNGSLDDAGKELDRWMKTDAQPRNESNTARKLIKAALAPYMRSGLNVDFKKDFYKYWHRDYTADYQINPATKGNRLGASGGDQLLEIHLTYYPDGKETFYILDVDMVKLLGWDDYRSVKKDIIAKLTKAFPNKTLESIPSRDFKKEAEAAKAAKNPTTGPTTTTSASKTGIYHLGRNGELAWNGSGKYTTLKTEALKALTKHRDMVRVSTPTYLLQAVYSGGVGAWTIHKLTGAGWKAVPGGSFPMRATGTGPSAVPKTSDFLRALRVFYDHVINSKIKP